MIADNISAAKPMLDNASRIIGWPTLFIVLIVLFDFFDFNNYLYSEV